MARLSLQQLRSPEKSLRIILIPFAACGLVMVGMIFKILHIFHGYHYEDTRI